MQEFSSIDILVNTHANAVHFYGNQLVQRAEIISSRACVEEMNETPPQMLAEIMKAAPGMGEVGAYIFQCFGSFNFKGITVTPPTRTFDDHMKIKVGDKEVDLIEVGPAHTRGELLICIPEDRTVFTGDIFLSKAPRLCGQDPWPILSRPVIGFSQRTLRPSCPDMARLRLYF